MTFVLPRDPSTSAPMHNPVATRRAAAAEKSGAASASYLAHDTRNWLTVLQMYCDLLRTPGAVASGHQNWIDELSGAVERGQELVASLLDSVQEAHQESSGLETGLDAAPQQAPPRPSLPSIWATRSSAGCPCWNAWPETGSRSNSMRLRLPATW